MTNPTLELLLTRRSAKTAELMAPGPSASELDTILSAAARVPDHKALAPWRFIVFEGGARARFGEALAAIVQAEEKEPPSPVRLDTERQRLMGAPVVIAVVSRANDVPGAPEWEQVLSAGAACQNLVIAATALGYGVQWVTRWYAYSPAVAAHLGLAPGERIAGFIHIGTAPARQAERKRPALSEVVTRYPG
ncbi:MAG: nitroreductase [Hyphomicrobiaceae bacterium]